MSEFQGFKGKLIRDFSLASKTTWRVGGKAEFFAIPIDQEDLLCLLVHAKKVCMPVFVLGRGSNLLIDDTGVRGLVILMGPAFEGVLVEGNVLKVGGSFSLPALARKAASLGFSGFEHLIGIPGTVGAGVVINAGKGATTATDMRCILNAVTCVDGNLRITTIGASDLRLAYRTSCLKGTDNIVLSANFNLVKPANTEEILAQHSAILRERREKFPLNYPNAGSVFKKPENTPPAGKLIEVAGLKGYQIGKAQISSVHANFIVNLGGATSQNIKDLMKLAQERVFESQGVYLEPEVVLWPEKKNWTGR